MVNLCKYDKMKYKMLHFRHSCTLCCAVVSCKIEKNMLETKMKSQWMSVNSFSLCRKMPPKFCTVCSNKRLWWENVPNWRSRWKRKLHTILLHLCLSWKQIFCTRLILVHCEKCIKCNTSKRRSEVKLRLNLCITWCVF